MDVLLTNYDTLLTTHGQLFFMVSNAVDTKCFLRSAVNVKVVRNANKC